RTRGGSASVRHARSAAPSRLSHRRSSCRRQPCRNGSAARHPQTSRLSWTCAADALRPFGSAQAPFYVEALAQSSAETLRRHAPGAWRRTPRHTGRLARAASPHTETMPRRSSDRVVPADSAQPAEHGYKALTRHLPEPRFVPLPGYVRLDEAQMLARAEAFYRQMDQRRTTRHFATNPVPRRLIELAIRTAGTAPSGAHRQPWRFVAIDDPQLKARIRAAAEEEELKTYSGRM